MPKQKLLVAMIGYGNWREKPDRKAPHELPRGLFTEDADEDSFGVQFARKMFKQRQCIEPIYYREPDFLADVFASEPAKESGSTESGTASIVPLSQKAAVDAHGPDRWYFPITTSGMLVSPGSLWQQIEFDEEPVEQYEKTLGHFRTWLRITARTQYRLGVAPIQPWAVARDANESVERRIAALWDLAAEQEHEVAGYVVAELCAGESSNEWRTNLVLLVEQIQIEEEHLRTRLRAQLLELALSMRHSTAAGIRPVVLSAVRTYASMLEPEKAATLMPLLDPPKPIETRLVALQKIVHLFERRPPIELGPLQLLADRVAELATKFLDRDLLDPGEKAAIGQAAAHALGALGDQRLHNCVTKIKALQMPWLTRQMIRKLDVTLGGWQCKPDLVLHPASKLVEKALCELRN